MQLGVPYGQFDGDVSISIIAISFIRSLVDDEQLEEAQIDVDATQDTRWLRNETALYTPLEVLTMHAHLRSFLMRVRLHQPALCRLRPVAWDNVCVTTPTTRRLLQCRCSHRPHGHRPSPG